MRRLSLALLLALVATVTVVAVLPASAAGTYEVFHVQYKDDITLRVEVQRDPRFDAAKQPVILTLSPYNNLGSAGNGMTADDGIASSYNPRGYARAVADVIGTRGSTGCWDYGGIDEQMSGVAVVEFLAGNRAENLDGSGATLDWSNGNVGMIGGSYDGTTAFMVGETGTPGLAGIVPEVAISRWYDYAYENGVRYFLNSFSPDNEGFDTPLAFDFGFGRTVEPWDALNDPEELARVAPYRAGECDSIEHTQEAYNSSPDYDEFWLDRDYLVDSNYRVPMLITSGWQDFNVKQVNSTQAFERIPVDDPETPEVEGVPFKLLWMEQHTHAGPGRSEFGQLLGCFWAVSLRDLDPVTADDDPACNADGKALLLTMLDGHPVMSESRDLDGEIGAGDPAGTMLEAGWPIPSVTDVTLHLGLSDAQPGVLSPEAQDTGTASWLDTGAASELVVERRRGDGFAEHTLYYATPPLERDVRVAGRVLVDAFLQPQVAGGAQFTPIVLDVGPDGDTRVMGRGFLNLDYRNGQEQAEPGDNGAWLHAPVETLPQDYTFRKGHRIALMTMSSNTIWAVPGTPAGQVTIANGPVADVTEVGSTISLPVVDGPSDAMALFTPVNTPTPAEQARAILATIGSPSTW